MGRDWTRSGNDLSYDAVTLLGKCREVAPVALPPGLDGGLRYGLARVERKQDGFCDLVIHVDGTRKTGPGARFVLSPAAIRLFQDPADRFILASLYGAWRQEEDESRPLGDKVRLWGAMSAVLVPKMAWSGRLLLVNQDEELEEDGPVGLAEDPQPWTLVMKVDRDKPSGVLTFTGMLKRGKEERSILGAELTSDGWFVDGHTLSRYEADPLWCRFFLKHTRFKVEERDLADYLLKLGKLGHKLPTCVWPSGVKSPFVQGVRPVPVLELTPPYLSTVMWMGKVTFLYGKLSVSSELEAVSYSPSGGVLVARDPDAEALCLQQLADAGFESWTDMQQLHWGMDSEKVGSAVPELSQQGWRVQVAGKQGGTVQIRHESDWTLQAAYGVDWFDLNGVQWGVGLGLRSVSAADLVAAISENRGFVIIPGSGEAFVIPGELKRLIMTLLAWGKQAGGTIKVPKNKAQLIGILMAEAGAGGTGAAFGVSPGKINAFDSIKPCDPPPTFSRKFTLRQYQKEGLGWLHFLRDFGFGGCLADDMGLGKTVQVIALLEGRRLEREKDRTIPPSLVIVPRSLVFNWVAEIGRFAPGMRVHAHAGSGRFAGTALFNAHDVIITTYGTVRSDLGLLKTMDFDYVVLDEAHEIRNAEALCSRAVKVLKARHRLAVTGTPVMNYLGDLKSIFEFLNPGIFTVLGKLQDPKKKGQGKGFDFTLSGSILRPFILRREKSKVAKDLPLKTEQTLQCDLSDEERLEYDTLRDLYRQTLLKQVDAEGMAVMQMHVLAALTKLRQLACHRGLLDSSKIGDGSSKLDMLMDRVKQVVQEGHKVLVFSQFTSLLAIVRPLFDAAGLTHAYLDGKTPPTKRAEEINRFQTDKDVSCFLLSLKAGGLGLNLTAADYVFIIDPWWNPAIEQQAMDRAHRIGQKRPVFAYRIIMRDTVEEKMMELHARKRALVEGLLTEDNARITSLTRDDLALLLS